jgi:hypothetical protein
MSHLRRVIALFVLAIVTSLVTVETVGVLSASGSVSSQASVASTIDTTIRCC